MSKYFTATLLLFMPMCSYAAITINEVAWMGTTNSANDEWIELYNSGSSESLDGWTLTDGMGLTIDLSGTLSAQSYAVLERTDDDSAPGSAFLIYTGSLTNSGATLTLRRDDGGIEDQVAGGENWEQIGGDNSTKETAQYSTLGWVTGSPTPGTKNVTNAAPSEPESDTDTDDESDTHQASSNDTHISLSRPDNKLELTITGPTQGYVNQKLDLFVEADGLGERIMDSLTYTWNLGNLMTDTGDEVLTRYAHPGEYVVVVEGVYADYEAVARHNITILPTALSLERNHKGDVLIHNNASYEVDLSGYKLHAGDNHSFPEYSLLAPRATLTISEEESSSHLMAGLYDSAGVLVASVLPAFLSMNNSQVEPTSVASVAVAEPIERAALQPVGLIAATSTSRVVNEDHNEEAVTAGVAQITRAADADTTAGIPNDKLPYLGLMALISVGILALYTRVPGEEKDTEKAQPFGLK